VQISQYGDGDANRNFASATSARSVPIRHGAQTQVDDVRTSFNSQIRGSRLTRGGSWVLGTCWRSLTRRRVNRSLVPPSRSR